MSNQWSLKELKEEDLSKVEAGVLELLEKMKDKVVD